MDKYLVGYKQADGKYVYVDSINSYNIGVTLDINNALEFEDNTMAKNMCDYLGYVNKEQVFKALKVTIDIVEMVEEVETDVATNE